MKKITLTEYGFCFQSLKGPPSKTSGGVLYSKYLKGIPPKYLKVFSLYNFEDQPLQKLPSN